MHSLEPIYYLSILYIRLARFSFNAENRLCTDKIYLCQELIRRKNGRHLRTHHRRELGKDTDYFASLLSFQLTNTVISLDNFGRFYKDRLASSRLIVNYTSYPTLHARSYRNNQTSVAHSGGNILIYISIRLRSTENAVKAARYAPRSS